MGIFLRGRVELFTGGTVSCCWIPERDDAGWSQNCMPSLHLPERKGCALYRRVSELLLSPKEGWRREWEEWLHEGRRSIYITFDEKRYGKTYKDSYIRCLISKKKKKRKEKRKSKKERKKERKKKSSMNSLNCMFLSWHVRVSEWIHTPYLLKFQGTPCSKQTRNLKFYWMQLDSIPEPLSS